jgi:hypothetical protein
VGLATRYYFLSECCLRSRYLAMADVKLLIYRSLPSERSTCHSIIVQYNVAYMVLNMADKTCFMRHKIWVPKATRGFEPISCRGAILSTLLLATVYVFTQFVECTVTDCK